MIDYLPLQQITKLYEPELSSTITRVVSSGWYLQGQETKKFETNYAQFIGTKHCVSCGNGLDALSLIFRAYKELGKLKEGDEVIVPANTYIATILSITENRLKPVLVEPNLDTLEIDDQLIEDAITEKTRAIMIVHLYGRCAYTETIKEICKRHNLLLLEDNAQAHGCRFGDQRTGSLGEAAAHSFYPGKNLGALGDAGAVTTNDEQLAKTIKMIANYGSSRKYEFAYQGQNSRMDELQAAVLNVKLAKLVDDNRRRCELANKYYNGITNPSIKLTNNNGRDNVYHIFPIFCTRRDELKLYLEKRGIATMIHYPIPPHQQQAFREWNERQYPITETIHQQELSLPCHLAMSNDDCRNVILALNEWRET